MDDMRENEEKKFYIGLIDETNINNNYDCYIWADQNCVEGIDWCKTHEKEYIVIPKIAENREELLEVTSYLDKVRNKLLNFLSKELNIYNGTDYSEDEWNIFIGQWLGLYLSSYYDKYRRIKRIDAVVNQGFVQTYNICSKPAILDYIDYRDLLFEDMNFARYQYSRLFTYIGFKGCMELLGKYERPKIKNFSNKKPKNVIDFYRNYFSEKEKNNIEDTCAIRCSYFKFSLYKDIMSEYSQVTGYPETYLSEFRNNAEIKIDDEWRSKKREFISEDEFEDIVGRIIFDELPIVHLEQFCKTRKTTDLIYRYAKKLKTLIVDDSAFSEDECLKHLIVESRRNGSAIIDVQHGGIYGICEYWSDVFSIKNSDIFITTGWQREYSKRPKFIQMPFLKNIYMDEYETSSMYPLYLSYTGPKITTELFRFYIDIADYMAEEVEFFKSLSENTKRNLRIRLDPRHNGWNQKELFDNQVDNLLYDEEPGFYNSISRASIVICEIFSTTSLEAIYLDKPFLILIDPREIAVYPMDPEIEDMIEKMVACGIIAQTSEKLAATLEEAINDIPKWWNDSERKKVVCLIKERYVNCSKRSKEEWIRRIGDFV